MDLKNHQFTLSQSRTQIDLTLEQLRNLEILVMDARFLAKTRKHTLTNAEIEELIPLVQQPPIKEEA
tara:strand:+ start:242 stop:442 length:201 start_codon:yes stop_codon:yes gene_type:complete